MIMPIKLILCLGLLVHGTLLKAQENYSLSPESILTVEGTSTVHDWAVTAHLIKGKAGMNGKVPQNIDFQVDVASMKSERGETMDTKMYNALKKDEHPIITFKLVQIKNDNILVGALNIAGKSQKVEIESSVTATLDNIKISGHKKIALKDFDMEPPTAMFGQVIVGDDVVVKFDLVFKLDK